jgi:Dolichyl-phosphate-mannose-protein mannosyltransferase
VPRGSALRAGAALAALVVVSTALRWWAAHRIPTPWIAPDELLYGLLGRGLYETGHLELLGHPIRFFSLVTPALVGPPLQLRNLETGYDVVKGVQALVMSLAAVPVYLWGRAFLRPGWALGAAALTLTIPGLVYSGLIMTEDAFFPALLLAAWGTAAALERPTPGRQLLALAAIVLATATRLQGAVLVLAFVTAVGLDAWFARAPRRALRFWPFAAGSAVLAVAWAAYRLRNGGPLSQVLGGYQAAGETHYALGDAARFVLYHLGDVLVFTAAAPVCAFALVCWNAVRGEEPPAVRAYVATTVAVALWLVLEVGVFASRHIGQLAERNLFGLAPLFFLGFALWLQRGLPRPRLASAVVAVAALALLLALPVERFVSAAALPDSFTLIPLYKLGSRSSVSLELVADVAFVATVLAFVAVPRRFGVALAVALGVWFAAVSVEASRVVAGEAARVQPGTLGNDKRWVDRHARGDVAYLYSGDVYWNSVWETLFWNKRVTGVYDMLLAQIPGGLPQPSVGPEEDGRVVTADGRIVPFSYVVASSSMRFRGTRLASSVAGVALWRLDPPFRLATWVQNVQYNGVVTTHAKVFAYACRGGRLRIRLSAAAPRTLRLYRNERLFRTIRLAGGGKLRVDVPAQPPTPRGTKLCSFDLFTNGPVKTTSVSFEPAAG